MVLDATCEICGKKFNILTEPLYIPKTCDNFYCQWRYSHKNRLMGRFINEDYYHRPRIKPDKTLKIGKKWNKKPFPLNNPPSQEKE